ncbi:MAG: diacylglycerol kinase [Bacteroidetes bacterium MedPE-SWsnd-G2]|nr:MAG: diacylglycerol kinase [Bacteroidetes bacterium MedPE-SWsnd-G2]
MSKDSFLLNRIKSIGYAFKGAKTLVLTESSIKIQAIIAIAVSILGFVVNISTTEWLIQIVCIGLVMSIEGVNTAIEYIADFVHPEHHEKIGRIKDIAAGAVFIAAMAATAAAIVIYYPKLF